MDSALPKVCHPEKDTQWCLVDVGQLNGLLCHIKCPSCETATLSFSHGEGHYGFCSVCANGMTDLLDKCPVKETFLPDISRF